MIAFRESTTAACAALAMAYGTSATASPLPDPPACSACFIGELTLVENPNDHTGSTKRLGEDLYFIDPDRFVWKAGKGDVTDGATIPALFQPIVGGPFENDYLPAAVIHDHYTDKEHRVRPWRDTARVFYQAMVVKGVSTIKAKVMYYAVYAFGPHWDALAPGVDCGKNCVFKAPVELQMQAEDGQLAVAAPVMAFSQLGYAEEPADYSLDHAAELEAVKAKVEASEIQGDPLSLDELARMARLNQTQNVFLRTATMK